MARLTAEETDGLNVALNEAQLVSAELDVEDRRVRVTLAVHRLPEGSGTAAPDPRIQLNLHPVGRLAVSYRRARWDDPDAPAVPLTASELPAIVASFGHLPI